VFFFSSRRRHTRSKRDWSSDVCSSDLARLSRYRLVLPDDAGIGQVPVSDAKADSDRILSGLPPAVISSWAIVSVPAPNTAIKSGACSLSRRARRVVRSRICSVSSSQRRARTRRAYRVVSAAVTGVRLGRLAANAVVSLLLLRPW